MKVINLPAQPTLLWSGRNIWKNDFTQSLSVIKKVTDKIGSDRVLIASSCSLRHSPCDLDLETNEKTLTPEIKQWLAFAKQKINEIVVLKALAVENPQQAALAKLEENKNAIESRRTSKLIHNQKIKERVNSITAQDSERVNSFSIRKKTQQEILQLSLFPTTTIDSFPQTAEVRSWRSQFKKGDITPAEYDNLLKEETERTIRWQEEIGIDAFSSL